MGWEQVQNGSLLANAAKAFDVLLTVDQNMKREQNLAALPIAIIVLVARKNIPDALLLMAPFVDDGFREFARA